MTADPGFAIARQLSLLCTTDARFKSSESPLTSEHLRYLETELWRDIMRPGPLWSNIRLVHEGRDLHPSKFMDARIGDGLIAHSYLNAAQVNRYLLDGATFIHNHLQETSVTVQRIQESLEYLLNARVWVQAYLARTTESAFGTHVDDHNVIVLQVCGHKLWRAYEPSSETPAIDAVLSSGDALYLAANNPHAVSGSGALSLHLTIAFEWLEQTRRFGSHIPDAARTAHRSARRQGGALPLLLDTGGDFGRYTFKFAGRVRPDLNPDEGKIRLKDGDMTMLLDARLLPVLQHLAEGRSASFAELQDVATDLNEKQVRSFLTFALQNQLVYC